MPSLIHSAIEAGDFEFVQKMFQYDGVPDINVFDERGLTPLHAAVLFEQHKIVELLLKTVLMLMQSQMNQIQEI